MIWKVFQALFVAAATLRNLGEGDLPHQMRPASQKAWHPAPSCVPQLQRWGGRPGGVLKLSSPFHAAETGLCVQLGIRRKIFEGEPVLLRAESPILWAKFALQKGTAG